MKSKMDPESIYWIDWATFRGNIETRELSYPESIFRITFLNECEPRIVAMPSLEDPEQLCAFCTLVLQLGYDHLTQEDAKSVSTHLKVFHHLKPYEIPA